MSLKKFEDFDKTINEKAKLSKSSNKSSKKVKGKKGKKGSKLKRDISKKPNPMDKLLKQFEGYDNSDMSDESDMGLGSQTAEREYGFYWVEIGGKMTIAEWANDPDGNDFWIPAGEEFEPEDEPRVIEYIEPPLNDNGSDEDQMIYQDSESQSMEERNILKNFKNFSQITEKKKAKKETSGLTAGQKKLPKPMQDAILKKMGKSPKKDDKDSKKDDKKDKEEVKGSKGLSAKQKKLPPALQKAILSRKK